MKPLKNHILTEDEVWVPCPGFEAYEVSSYGRVRRIAQIQLRIGPRGGEYEHKIQARLMKTWIMPNGYVRVAPYDARRRPVHTLVHRLVCEAFNGPQPPLKPEVDHINGIRTDNRADNLRWADKVDQKETSEKIGTLLKGDRHPLAKMSDSDVAFVRKVYKTKGKPTEAKALAREFGVSKQCIYDIVNGRRR
jgi:hypothetical protein